MCAAIRGSTHFRKRVSQTIVGLQLAPVKHVVFEVALDWQYPLWERRPRRDRRRDNSAWLSPNRFLTRRANLAASRMASASSSACCVAMSSSVVASTRAESIRPETWIAALLVMRTVFIVSRWLALRADIMRKAPWREV